MFLNSGQEHGTKKEKKDRLKGDNLLLWTECRIAFWEAGSHDSSSLVSCQTLDKFFHLLRPVASSAK